MADGGWRVFYRGMPATPDFFTTALRLDAADVPDDVIHQARRCLLDTLGVAAGASRLPLTVAADAFSLSQFAPGDSPLLFRTGSLAPAGAALANALAIDALDLHDGHNLTKGHAGVAVVAALLAFPRRRPGGNFLVDLVVGYEVAVRAGIALHRTSREFHTSGAWNALGCALVATRCLGLGPDHAAEALGIAEFYAPRSPMMRCIAHPTMVKDGSGVGAWAGVSAALLAQEGFTGAPAELLAGGSGEWEDFGSSWHLRETYFKPFPVCRWAHPALVAARQLRPELGGEEIRSVKVETFAEAVCLATRKPATTEEAQYSLPFPLAAMLLAGKVDPESISGPGLAAPAVLDLAARIELVEEPSLSALFPARRRARLTVVTATGRTLQREAEPVWEGTSQPTDDELLAKFVGLVEPRLGQAAAALGASILRSRGTPEEMAALLSLLSGGAGGTGEDPAPARPPSLVSR